MKLGALLRRGTFSGLRVVSNRPIALLLAILASRRLYSHMQSRGCKFAERSSTE